MSRTGGRLVSETGAEVEGATIGDAGEDGVGDEGGGSTAALLMVACAEGKGTAAAPGKVGIAVAGVVVESGGVTGGTTVRDGRAGSVVTTATTSSGLRPSRSAFWISSAAMNSFKSAVLCADSARVPTLSL